MSNKSKNSSNTKFSSSKYYFKNALIISILEWAVYITSLVLINSGMLGISQSLSFDPSLLSITTNSVFVLPLLLINAATLYLFYLTAYHKTQITTLSRARLFWIITAFLMLYFAGRSLFITAILLGFDPCKYDWTYCIKRAYSQ